MRKRLPLGDTAKDPGCLPDTMKVRREFRHRRPDTEVAVLEALADRYEEGMTVFELRSEVGADIDELETALSNLKSAELIAADEVEQRTVITVDESVVETESPDATNGDIVQRILDRLGL